MSISTTSLISFLQTELAIPGDAIPSVVQACEATPDRLPVVLWQQRLVTLSQLDTIFNWMEECN